MPPVTRVIAAGSAGVSVETIKALHTELAAIGLPVVGAEAGATPQFAEATSAQLKAFQERYKLPVNGNLDPTTGGILTLAAVVATESERSTLREKLKNAVNAVPSSPDYNYWLARFALMAGDYDTAARVSPRLVDLSGAAVNLGDGVFTTGDGAAPQAPEVPFPENFYSYRYNVMSQADIEALRPSSGQSTSDRTFRIATRPSNGTTDTFDPPHDPVIYDPPTPTSPGTPRPQRLADSALAWLGAIEAWQFGNAEFARERYASAVDAYNRCQQAAISYFSIFPDYDLQFTTNTLPARIDELVWRLASDNQGWADVWNEINWRRQLLSLAELSQLDWTPITPRNVVYLLLEANVAGNDQPTGLQLFPAHRKRLMDARLVAIAAVLVPLARGEANRLRRQYVAAREDFSRVLRRNVPIPNDTTLTLTVMLACEFIEVPFARLLLIETILDQAEAQYKARLSVDDEPDDTMRTEELTQLGQIAQDFNLRQITGDAGNVAKPLQHLVAALTYADAFDVMREDGEYAVRTKQALDSLHTTLTSMIANADVSSMAFRSIGQTITVPTVSSIGNTLPGLTAGTHPHEPYLHFHVSDGQLAMRERNPRVYALLLQAQARLLQIWSGFNYLGYRDDYVPPWRFQYLLDRARYFSEHAKNAQRDYLNFLSNAESEEFKEMSIAQNVELEKANVRVETARVEQASLQVRAALDSAQLADLTAQDAAARASAYRSFDDQANALAGTGDLVAVLGAGGLVGGLVGDVVHVIGDVADFFTGGAVAKELDRRIASLQRQYELYSLQLASRESQQAVLVSQAQLDVAKAGLVVAGLERQTALLRHEFALQNLQFMRNRILNTEQWYRMAGAIRSVGDTYLRYAIETSFLAQQAYDFEADRRLNVIRFDYDLSSVGAMLAADFLLRDLDTLEQDLIVSQQTRQQQVRYVLSMAREFPETLRSLAETGEVTFSMRLEQLERHFPGLVNMRISSVELQAVALMDPARVSVQLTRLGTGMVRLKAQPGTSPMNGGDLPADSDWLPNVAADWPVKIHVSGPDTALFSGLSRQEAASLGMITANERAAFEGLPGASSWRIDMSMKENQVVPGTLADMLISFALSGYYDSGLNDAVTTAASSQRPFATTSFISARRALPDSYYSLVHYGKLDWTLSERMLSLAGTPNELRNLAVVLPLVPNGLELGRCYCRYPVQLEVSSGAVNVLTTLPQFTMTPTGLTLNCAFTGPAGTELTWDFDDGTPLMQGADVQHVYARPGRYEVVTRLAKDGKLVEYRSAAVVSANHPIVAPLIVTPTFSASAISPDGTVALTVSTLPGATDVSIDCSAGKVRAWADAGPITLNLKPGSHVIDFLAMRNLSARFYSKQRYLPASPVSLHRERVSTNRTFDPSTGVSTTTSPNAFTMQLFENNNVTISPVDRWTLELPLAENPWFTTVSTADVAEFDGSELNDAIVGLEFMVGEGQIG
jgi:hypothetical protein